MIKRLILTGAFSLIAPFIGFAQYAPSSTPAVENTTTTNFTADVTFAGEVAATTFEGDGSALSGISAAAPNNTTTTNFTQRAAFADGITGGTEGYYLDMSGNGFVYQVGAISVMNFGDFIQQINVQDTALQVLSTGEANIIYASPDGWVGIATDSQAGANVLTVNGGAKIGNLMTIESTATTASIKESAGDNGIDIYNGDLLVAGGVSLDFNGYILKDNGTEWEVETDAVAGDDIVNFTTMKAQSFDLSGALKADTGDPAGVEGIMTINTFDNVIKIYADGAWRTLASW